MMNFRMALVLFVSLTAFNLRSATIYTNLFATWGTPASITLRAGEVATIESHSFDSTMLTVELAEGKVASQIVDSKDDLELLPKVFAGPATITIKPYTSASRAQYCCISIKSLEDTFSPSTAVVIPSDSGGPVKIILESSVDLVTWT